MTNPGVPSLTQRRPVVPPDRLLAELVPPRHFADESFATYRPDPAHPSQAAAVTRLSAGRRADPSRCAEVVLEARARPTPLAVYLDGGFGVGKTHLLTSLAHAVGVQDAAYGTFVEYTNLVGALGFLPTVEALATRRLVCIDEFELDDPGDTVLMSRLLRELADRGRRARRDVQHPARLAGRGPVRRRGLPARDPGAAARFEVAARRRRRLPAPVARHRRRRAADGEVRARRVARTGRDASTTSATCSRTSRPCTRSRYGALLDGVGLVALTGVHAVPTQDVALRLVVLVDRLYDRDVPVLLGGAGSDDLFSRGDARRRLPQEVLPGAVAGWARSRRRRRARRAPDAAADQELVRGPESRLERGWVSPDDVRARWAGLPWSESRRWSHRRMDHLDDSDRARASGGTAAPSGRCWCSRWLSCRCRGRSWAAGAGIMSAVALLGAVLATGAVGVAVMRSASLATWWSRSSSA